MRRLYVLMIILVVLSLPVSTSAQAEGFVATFNGETFFEDGISVQVTVNWYDVIMTCSIDERILAWYQYCGYDYNYTYISQPFYYWEMGVECGEVYEMTLGFLNGTRVHDDPNFSYHEPEYIISLTFYVPFPDGVYEADDDPPLEVVEPTPVKGIEPYEWCIEGFTEGESMVIVGIMIVFGGLFVLFQYDGWLKRKRAKQRRKDRKDSKYKFRDMRFSRHDYGVYEDGKPDRKSSVLDPVDCGSAYKAKSRWKYYYPDSDEEAAQMERAGKFPAIWSNVKMGEVRILPDSDVSEMEEWAKENGVEEEWLAILNHVNMQNIYIPPQLESKKMPVFEDEDDDGEWRICMWCGEYNHGKSTRCKNCDGRLGRPLGRKDE